MGWKSTTAASTARRGRSKRSSIPQSFSLSRSWDSLVIYLPLNFVFYLSLSLLFSTTRRCNQLLILQQRLKFDFKKQQKSNHKGSLVTFHFSIPCSQFNHSLSFFPHFAFFLATNACVLGATMTQHAILITRLKDTGGGVEQTVVPLKSSSLK